MRFGYVRCSSLSQSLDIQIEEMEKAGCERIAQEKVSASSMDGRDELKGLLAILRPGDELWVSRLDRLARSVTDLIHIVARLEEAGATLHCINQPIETKTAMGRMVITILGAFAQFENEIRRERQKSGIDKARAAHKYKGSKRGPQYDRAVIAHMFYEQGMAKYQIAKKLGSGRQVVYLALKEIEKARAKEEANVKT